MLTARKISKDGLNTRPIDTEEKKTNGSWDKHMSEGRVHHGFGYDKMMYAKLYLGKSTATNGMSIRLMC